MSRSPSSEALTPELAPSPLRLTSNTGFAVDNDQMMTQGSQNGNVTSSIQDSSSFKTVRSDATRHPSQKNHESNTKHIEEHSSYAIEPYFDPKNDLTKFIVSYRDLSLSYMLNASQGTTNAIFQLPLNIITNIRYYLLCQNHVKKKFYRLAPTSGYFLNSESTLILSPPGGGRTTLPKICSQALPPSTGDLWFNGVTAMEAEQVYHIDAKKLTSYVDQVDCHFSEMTVYETLEFAHRLLTPHPSYKYLERLIEAFGMGECKNTLNSRISGGQGRRLSLMLGLCNPHIKLVAMDNLSDGLDHAVTQDIVLYMSKWAKLNNSIFIATLQQPAPSIFNQFDKIILLRDGCTVYHGPVADVSNYIGAMGFPCNPDGLPLPEHIIHILSHPKLAVLEQNLNTKTTKNKSNGPDSGSAPAPTAGRQSRAIAPWRRKHIDTSYGPIEPSLYPCIEVEEMVEFYLDSPFHKHIEQVLDSIEAIRTNNGFTKTKGMLEREENGQKGPGAGRISPNDENETFTTNANLIDTTKTTSNNLATFGTTGNNSGASHSIGDGAGAENTSMVRFNSALDVRKTGNSNQNSSQLTNSPTDIAVENPLQDGQLPPLYTEATHKYYKKGFSVSLYQLFCLVLRRQINLMIRNYPQLIARIIPAVIIGIVFAGLYFQLAVNDYSFRLASFIDVQTEVAYNNLIELGLFIYYRRLIHSQLNLYPTWIYTTSVFIAGIPYSLVEALVLTAIPYGMIGHSPYGFSIVTHFFILWIHGLVISLLFRLGASITANTGMAYAVVSPVISVLSLVAGFYVRPDNLPKWLIWLYWISPFAWGLRSMAQLEFLSPRYNYLIDNPANPGTLERAGTAYLHLLDVSTDPLWIPMSAVYCIGVIILFIGLSSYFLYAPNKEYSIGTRRFNLGEDDDHITIEADDQDYDEFQVMHQFQETSQVEEGENEDSPQVGAVGGGGGIELSNLQLNDTNSNQRANVTSTSGTSRTNNHEPSRSRFVGGNNKLITLTNELPFTPVTLSWDSIKFTVKAKDDNGQIYDRVLLQNITGYAQQGTLTALIGSSGAGKSTLANTLMGLNKTNSSQRSEGMIYINGHPVDGKSITHSQFTSLTAYVEQFDNLYPYDTVFETLMFSARSRLKDATEDILIKVVEEVMDVLELTLARDLIIGSPENPVLSPAQKKRVNIGVELVSNPSIIFLDEPVTGIDSEAAASVIRALHNIARSGRAIVCTIHQPSSQLFFQFDSLLLLGSGGFPLFFGRIGKWAKSMVHYFNAVDGFDMFKGNSNPAEWIVEEVSKPIPDQVQSRASQEFKNYQISLKNAGFKDDQFQELLAIDFDSLSPRAQWVAYLHMCFMKSSLWGRALQYLQFALPKNEQIKKYYTNLTSNNNTFNSPHFGLATAPTSVSDTALQSNSIDMERSRNGTIIPTSHHANKEMEIPEMSQHAILPLYSQFWQLTCRSSHLFTRSSSLFYTRLLSTFLLSLFFGVFYLHIDVNSTSQLIRFMAASIISIGNTTYITATTSLPVYVSLRPIWAREIFSNYYASWLWPISFMINEFIWAIPISVMCFFPHYFIIGASTDAAVFFSYWLVVIVMIVMFTQFTLALSLLLPARFTEVVQNVYVSLCFSFGNIAMTYPNTNALYKVLMRILPFFYVNRAITTQQFKHDTTPIDVFINDQAQVMPLNQWVTHFTGYRLGDNIYWWSILWLVVTIGVFASVSMLSSIFIRQRRY